MKFDSIFFYFSIFLMLAVLVFKFVILFYVIKFTIFIIKYVSKEINLYLKESRNEN